MQEIEKRMEEVNSGLGLLLYYFTCLIHASTNDFLMRVGNVSMTSLSGENHDTNFKEA